MKKVTLLAMALLTGSLSATTITAGGGTGGPQFFWTTDMGATKTLATNLTVSFKVGIWEAPGVFKQFGAADASPISISTIASLAGRWGAGNTDNNNTTAAAFNGQDIWFCVTATPDKTNAPTVTGTAYFKSTLKFPNANGGVGDSLTVDSKTLTTMDATMSTAGSEPYDATDHAGGIVIGVIPETSTTLLGALGALALLRRRR